MKQLNKSSSIADSINYSDDKELLKILKIEYHDIFSYIKTNNSETETETENNYNLLVISNDDYCHYPPTVTLKFKDCYYYIHKYNNLMNIFNELSVLDCGGYFMAVCIFYKKLNITDLILEQDPKSPFGYCMNTKIGHKNEFLTNWT